MRRCALAAVMSLIAWLFCVPARAGECTHDMAVQSMGVLQSVVDGGDHFGFPTLPTDSANIGPMAGIPYVETLDAAALTLQEKNVTAAHHQMAAVRYAVQDLCGAPLSAPEKAKAKALLDQFEPWVTAWEPAVTAERARRATDRAQAANICEVTTSLQQVQARITAEKANPSGVVDLAALHTDGQLVQGLTSILTARKTLFLRDRKKPFAPAMCSGAK